MPILTVQTFLKDQLDGLTLPLGLGALQAFIQPPPGGDDGGAAAAYIWGSAGDEHRLTVPRAQHLALATGGDKTLEHRPQIWLIWAADPNDEQLGRGFPAMIDAVMARLRNVELLDAVSQQARDPVTGQLSDILDVGENISWEYGPVRALADQRTLRFDAVLTPTVTEIIQA